VDPNLDIVERDPDDLAVLMYAPTGARTVRGCMLTHNNIMSNTDTITNVMNLGPSDAVMGVLALFAAYGQTVVMNAAMRGGAKLILHESFIPGEILKSLQHDQVSIFCGVPSMYVYMLNHPLIYQYDLSSIRLWIAGGAPLSKELIERWNNEMGARIYNGYGLTETSPVVAIQTFDGKYKPGSIGLPIPGVEVKILDEQGQEMPPGEVGELVVQGPNVMKGYFNKPEEQAQVLRAGWLYSGDMGYKDEDGCIFLVGRKKDLIIRGGFNIYPREIEEVLVTHPLITEAAVVGVPNKYLGEEVQAYIKLKPGATITEDQILEYCEDKLPYYKTPKFIKFVRSFKKDPSGQILKHLIEE
jgi:long-chain acyl-CoA synthetase